MNSASSIIGLHELPVLLRGEAGPIRDWTQRWSSARVLLYVGIILVGAGAFGAAMGCWRAGQQALYTAIKFPLIILLVTVGNALLNGMLAPLLGLNIPFRQTFLAILASFTIASAILGSFSPVLAYLIWNAPPLEPGTRLTSSTYGFILLGFVVVIAFAGVAANLRLVRLLRQLSGHPAVAGKVLFAWLAGNLFLGSQLCWIFRPFFGAPGLPVQFFRPEPFHGSFYESLFRTARDLFFR